MRCSCRVLFFLQLEARRIGRVTDAIEEQLFCTNTSSVACIFSFAKSLRHAVGRTLNETVLFRYFCDTFDAGLEQSDSKSLRHTSDRTTIGPARISFFFGALSKVSLKLSILPDDCFDTSMFASYIWIGLHNVQ